MINVMMLVVGVALGWLWMHERLERAEAERLNAELDALLAAARTVVEMHYTHSRN